MNIIIDVKNKKYETVKENFFPLSWGMVCSTFGYLSKGSYREGYKKYYLQIDKGYMDVR